jgi:hypothetical protein
MTNRLICQYLYLCIEKVQFMQQLFHNIVDRRITTQQKSFLSRQTIDNVFLNYVPVDSHMLNSGITSCQYTNSAEKVTIVLTVFYQIYIPSARPHFMM